MEAGATDPGQQAGTAAAAVAGHFPLAELSWDSEEQEHSWLNVAEGMEEGIRLWLVSLWQELRAIDIVLQEVADEFDGEDPLRPIMRGIVEKTRGKLTRLHELLAAVRPLELEEPDEEAMELVRTYFEKSWRLMASI